MNQPEERVLRVVDSSRYEFEATALAAVRQWQFRPGRKRFRAVETSMHVPVTFSTKN